jgi:hypothetical protein
MSDDDLEALFARQRAADHQRSPAFHAMRTRDLESRTATAASTSLLWRWGLTAACACGLALAALLTLRQHRSPSTMSREMALREIEQIDAAIQKNIRTQSDLTAWQSPTDFLLPIHNSTP